MFFNIKIKNYYFLKFFIKNLLNSQKKNNLLKKKKLFYKRFNKFHLKNLKLKRTIYTYPKKNKQILLQKIMLKKLKTLN
jgi:hypothetical protein